MGVTLPPDRSETQLRSTLKPIAKIADPLSGQRRRCTRLRSRDVTLIYASRY